MNRKVNNTSAVPNKPLRTKRPEIRMNLTTKMRLLKANPLLQFHLMEKTSNNSDSLTKISLTDLAKSQDVNLDKVQEVEGITTEIKYKPTTNFAQQRRNAAKNAELRKPNNQTTRNNVNTKKPPIVNTSKPKSTFTLAKNPKNTISQKTPINSARAAFKTPSAYERRSVNPKLHPANKPIGSCRNPQQLADNLRKWLTSRGKSLNDFHHLKCFGLHDTVRQQPLRPQPSHDENKENIACVDSASYEDLGIIDNEPAKKDNLIDLAEISKAALLDLHNLILAGYPFEQCDVWLNLIQEKCGHIVDMSDYWECKAALEQARGNVNSAVECYKTAIVHGAEVSVVDGHLDQLLDKFSLLDIGKEKLSNSVKKSSKKSMNDQKNIFKSSVIQFAIKERTDKMNQIPVPVSERKFVATPVRRSTRLSRSCYTLTPGVKLVSTLEEIDCKIKQKLDFQKNNALLL